jgi:hypothetical protein
VFKISPRQLVHCFAWRQSANGSSRCRSLPVYSWLTAESRTIHLPSGPPTSRSAFRRGHLNSTSSAASDLPTSSCCEDGVAPAVAVWTGHDEGAVIVVLPAVVSTAHNTAYGRLELADVTHLFVRLVPFLLPGTSSTPACSCSSISSPRRSPAIGQSWRITGASVPCHADFDLLWALVC